MLFARPMYLLLFTAAFAAGFGEPAFAAWIFILWVIYHE